MSNRTGFLISCFKNREIQCLKEFKKIANIHSKTNSISSLNFSDSLNQELKEKQNFERIHIDKLKNIIIIKNLDNCVEIYNNLRSMNIQTTYIQRLIPFELIFDINDIETIFDSFITNIKNTDVSYKLLIESRLSDKITKENVFNFVVSRVKLKVDLDKPDFLFVVQICKNFVGASFLKNDNTNFNFNRNKLKK
ncbi:hypothetical protein GVAV_002907 [Gurleya vavrai]